MRLAAHAHDRCDQSGLFTADERTGTDAHFKIEAEISAKNVLTQKAKFARLGDRDIQRFYSNGIFGTAVDISITRADRIRADDHALDHTMRIAFQHTAVHERA